MKKNWELTYLGLEDARINLHRTDSIWNYQFLINYFSSTDTTPKKKKPLDLQIKKIDCKRLQLIQDDRWVGEKMIIKSGALLVNIDKSDLANQTFIIHSIYLDQPFFQLQNLDGLRPPIQKAKVVSKQKGLYFNPGNLNLQVKQIKIKNGSIWIDDNMNKPEKGFDEAHIDMSKLNAEINQFQFLQDTLKAGIQLSVKDRSGFELKQLKTQFKFTPQIMEFDSLDLVTAKSHLRNYYAMKFSDFNEDFSHYLSKVTMAANFNQSTIHTDDIAYFAPELTNLHTSLKVSGKFLGTVEDYTVTVSYTHLTLPTNREV